MQIEAAAAEGQSACILSPMAMQFVFANEGHSGVVVDSTPAFMATRSFQVAAQGDAALLAHIIGMNGISNNSVLAFATSYQSAKASCRSA